MWLNRLGFIVCLILSLELNFGRLCIRDIFPSFAHYSIEMSLFESLGLDDERAVQMFRELALSCWALMCTLASRAPPLLGILIKCFSQIHSRAALLKWDRSTWLSLYIASCSFFIFSLFFFYRLQLLAREARRLFSSDTFPLKIYRRLCVNRLLNLLNVPKRAIFFWVFLYCCNVYLRKKGTFCCSMSFYAIYIYSLVRPA